MQTQRRQLLRIVTALGLSAIGSGIALLHAQPAPRVINVSAHKFTYDPDVITLKVNEPVLFRLTTLDVVMGFSVPDFGVRGTILPGQTTEVAMTPNKTGDFTFLCDVFCGTGHETMEGTLHVIA